MSVGDTKGKQVEQIIKDKKPKVSPARGSDVASSRVGGGGEWNGMKAHERCIVGGELEHLWWTCHGNGE